MPPSPTQPKRIVWLGVIFGVLLAFGAVVVIKLFLPHWSGDWLTNEAGPISKRPDGTIRGVFVVKPGSPNIKSRGMGGACYVADLEFADWPRNKNSSKYEGARCTDNTECNPINAQGIGNPKLASFPDKAWHGYCVPNPSSADRKCWVRPGGDSLCSKSSINNGGAPWPIGLPQDLPDLNNLLPISNGIGKEIDPKTLTWRVGTCLLPVNPDKLSEDLTMCGDKRALERSDGPTFKLQQ